MIEPSCATALLDDLPDLMDSTDFNPKGNIFLLEDFLIQEKIREIQFRKVIIYFMDIVITKQFLAPVQFINYLLMQNSVKWSRAVVEWQVLSDMIKTITIYQKIGELSVLSKVKIASEDTTILTSGFSCKHQIADFTDKKPLHWLEVIEV